MRTAQGSNGLQSLNLFRNMRGDHMLHKGAAFPCSTKRSRIHRHMVAHPMTITAYLEPGQATKSTMQLAKSQSHIEIRHTDHNLQAAAKDAMTGDRGLDVKTTKPMSQAPLGGPAGKQLQMTNACARASAIHCERGASENPDPKAD